MTDFFFSFCSKQKRHKKMSIGKNYDAESQKTGLLTRNKSIATAMKSIARLVKIRKFRREIL